MRASSVKPLAFAKSLSTTTVAEAPSLKPGAFPAVTVQPSWNAGISFASVSIVESPRKPVLLFSRNPELLGDNLRLVTHVNILKSAPQTIMNDRVYNLAIAHAVPRARLRQQVRSIAHALHAAGHKRLLIARAYRLRRQHHSLQAGATHLIHSKRRNIDRKPGVNRGLSRRRLSNTRRDHIPHNNFV